MHTDNAKITLKSIIDNLSDTGLPSDDREVAESTAIGTLTASDRGAVLSFSEESEGGQIKTKIEILGERVRVCRHGAIESEMVFAEGKSHDSLYSVVPYAFDVTVKARKIRNSLTKSGGALDVFYDMHIGGADKNVRMKLTVKEMPTTA